MCIKLKPGYKVSEHLLRKTQTCPTFKISVRGTPGLPRRRLASPAPAPPTHEAARPEPLLTPDLLPKSSAIHIL